MSPPPHINSHILPATDAKINVYTSVSRAYRKGKQLGIKIRVRENAGNSTSTLALGDDT